MTIKRFTIIIQMWLMSFFVSCIGEKEIREEEEICEGEIISQVENICEQEKSSQDGVVLKREYFSNGEIKSEGSYLKDTIKHGLFRYFYPGIPDGALMRMTQYKDGVKHGCDIKYYANGVCRFKRKYYEGVLDGWSYEFYSDGKLKSKTFWLNGQRYGDGFYYELDCKIYEYCCIDNWGNCFYKVRYDSMGKKIKEEGLVFSTSFSVPCKKDSVVVCQEYPLEIAVANPPGAKARIFVGDVTEGKKIKNLKEYPVKDNTAAYSKTYDTPGKYEFAIIGELRDRQTDAVIRKDTVFLYVMVKDNIIPFYSKEPLLSETL